ncbi:MULTISPECIES: MBL fold metallo-hydrolase [Mesobacillus]|uniref:Beta-lactamase n=2 Tax=Mesobacillus TaxID=2675231 RepID=A0A0D6ZF08_9BACI|nr:MULTISPECIES: MBL fold metallo-hydrolase [Mesobacillus]KIY23840.1 beta-lactamase [Mesobacillus subterraneus]MDQ0413757.1 glyoxylase-like metal-dependent hydrolase (beta-lactamase superfamily II) [Mesobacillus stamsii]
MVEWKDGIAKLTLPTPFSVGDVNAYLIKGDRLTLVDAGTKTKESWESFQSQLSDLRLKPEDVEQVILTHDHPDHVGMLDYLSPDLEVYGHHLNERWINRTSDFEKEHKEFYEKIFMQSAIPEQYFVPSMKGMKKALVFSCNRSLTGTILENDVPPALPGWKVIETPGHAQSHIVLLREKDGTMIAGDTILAGISPNPLLEPPLPGELERPRSLVQYNTTLKKLQQYRVGLVYTGHGTEIMELHRLIDKRLARQHDRAMQVRGMLEGRELTVFEICKLLFPTVYERELNLTISETVGQLDYLQSLDAISVREEGDFFVYTAK